MKLPKPPFDCYGPEQQAASEKWTIERLRSIYADESLDALKEQINSRLLKRKQILAAIKAKDKKALVRLLDTEAARKFALEPRKRGRPLDFAIVKAAWDTLMIKRIWRDEYGNRNRTTPPSALDIAARFNELNPDQTEQLYNYLNQGKKKRAR
jgi:hypothetical protein